MAKKIPLETTSMSLHIMAMVFMLCDHLWGTIVPGNDWMTCVGRMAFPIFAFLIVEGYFHTRDLKKYAGRLALFAVLSEIPFNLMMGSAVFYPLDQNVLWSFLISIGLIHLNEKAKGKLWRRILAGAASVVLGYILGMAALVDYSCMGIFTVLTFYFFRQRKWWGYAGQFLCLAYINMGMAGGFTYIISIFGMEVHFVRQGWALLALVPIWLYRGKQGPHNKALQYLYYAFYPVHILVLYLVRAALG